MNADRFKVVFKHRGLRDPDKYDVLDIELGTGVFHGSIIECDAFVNLAIKGCIDHYHESEFDRIVIDKDEL